jgi:hypothetical protein
MNNLIITTAVGYRPRDIWTFLASAAQHCPTAEIVAIVHPRDLKALAPCCERFPTLQLYPLRTPLKPLQQAQGLIYKLRRVLARGQTWLLGRLQALGFSLQLADEGPSWLGFSSTRMFILNRRFFVARRIIAARRSSTASVLLSDSRDVVFQADPFAVMGSGCHTGMEYRIMAESPINAQWIRSTYGDVGFEALKDQLVLCSGVTLGSCEGVLAYLDHFCAEIADCAVRLRTVLIPIWDQAYHNKLLRLDAPHLLTPMPWQSDLATVGEVPTEQLNLDAAGVVRVGGIIPAILHQYDRHPAISAAIAARYACPLDPAGSALR